MLRSLLLLFLVGVCLARVNYRTTNKEVSQEEKERILDNDDDEVSVCSNISNNIAINVPLINNEYTLIDQ